MRLLALSALGALGGALALNAIDSTLSVEAQAQNESAASIIAVQIRKQGFTCENPQSADRDEKASKPDLPVWILKCDNATYRVRVVANMADRVERLD